MEQVIRVVISLLHIDLNSLGSVHSLSVPCDLGSYQVKGWARLGTAALRFCGYQLLPLANTIENSPEKRERLNMTKSTSWRQSFSQLFVVTQFIVTTCLSKIQKWWHHLHSGSGLDTIAPSIFHQLINAMARTAASDEAEPLTGDRVGEYLQQLLRTGSGNVPKIRIGDWGCSLGYGSKWGTPKLWMVNTKLD